mgnify:CR=1 FL=1
MATVTMGLQDMLDLQQGWLRVRDLPADVLNEMPDYLRGAFTGARRFDFEVEMICAGVRVPAHRRAKRRLVLVADDGEDAGERGPLGFDLNAVAADVRASRRVFVVSAQADHSIFANAYAAAVGDLAKGSTCAVVIETDRWLEPTWIRALTALRSCAAIAVNSSLRTVS